jgi:hypothetical protein
MKLVLPNRREVSIKDLKKAREIAIEKYYKAEKSINKATIIKQEAEDIIQGCDSRIRLLTLMSARNKNIV